MYQRRHLNFYRKQTDGWDCTRRVSDSNGLSVWSRTPAVSPREAPSLSYSVTPKPEAPRLITAAEKPVLFSPSRSSRGSRPSSGKGRDGCLPHLARTETEELSRECSSHTQ